VGAKGSGPDNDFELNYSISKSYQMAYACYMTCTCPLDEVKAQQEILKLIELSKLPRVMKNMLRKSVHGWWADKAKAGLDKVMLTF